MLENWCWKKDSLKLLSSHYKDGSQIDDKLMDDLIKSKNSASGYFNMRLLIFLTFLYRAIPDRGTYKVMGHTL